jgi:hypothetical protein
MDLGTSENYTEQEVMKAASRKNKGRAPKATDVRESAKAYARALDQRLLLTDNSSSERTRYRVGYDAAPGSNLGTRARGTFMPDVLNMSLVPHTELVRKFFEEVSSRLNECVGEVESPLFAFNVKGTCFSGWALRLL